jgi:RNA polymerase sigma factor (TIGR02999 family)
MTPDPASAPSPVRDAVTVLLDAAGRGDTRAADDLLPLLYGELRRLAESRLAQQPAGHTLQATALVHEAFLRLVGKDITTYENRGHFFFAAARAMRDILVERARQKAGPKAGGGMRRVELDQLSIAMDSPAEELLALHEALERLEKIDAEKHQIVSLRFFAGLTNEQAAAAMGVPLRNFERSWRFARAWLHQELSKSS